MMCSSSSARSWSGNGNKSKNALRIVRPGARAADRHDDFARDTKSGACVGRAERLQLGEWGFELVASLAPERDQSGAIIEYSPQGRYQRAGTIPLHKHGHGTFCKFRINVPAAQAGVYALVVDGDVRYVGECDDLRERFNTGYGIISPRNCYAGGQMTNCKINRRVLDVSKAGNGVDVYFHPSSQRKSVEARLIEQYSPPWNG